MTVAEAAAYMRISEAEVLALIEQGKLAAARIGDTYRIARIAIDDFVAQG
jgi:excisionase family DNA binding protein